MKSNWMFIGFVLVVIFFLMFLEINPANAQTWYPTNQAKVGWDAVTKYSDGTTIPSEYKIMYRVYRVSASDTSKANPTEISVIDGTVYTFTFPTPGKYFVGVKSEVWQGETKLGESVIAWSDNPQYTSNSPFGIQYTLPPEAIKGMKPIQ